MTEPIEEKEQNCTPSKDIFYRVTLWCALVPLFLGTGIFITWLKFRWSELEFIGFMVFSFSHIVVALGLISLCIYIVRRFLRRDQKIIRVLFDFIWALLLILINFPAGYTIVRHAEEVKSQPCILTIYNQSTNDIDHLTVKSADKVIYDTVLRAGQHTSISDYRFPLIRYTANCRTKSTQGIIDEGLYAGESALVIFQKDSEPVILTDRNRD